MRKSVTIIAGIAALLSVRVTHAQLAETYSLPRPANCCLLNTATTLAEQLQDWNQLGRYHEANQELMKRPAEPGRVVFMGDSITDGYRLEEAFPGKPYVNRGISGQTRRRCWCWFSATQPMCSRLDDTSVAGRERHRPE